MTIDFKELLKNAAKQFPSQQAFAEAIGVSTARLNRALNKGDYPFNVLNCLRLAKVTGAKPSAILRAAGKGEVAELVEGLYGEVDSTITPNERAHLNRWRKLDLSKKRAIEVLTEGARDESLDPAARALLELFSLLGEEKKTIVIRSVQRIAGKQPGESRREQDDAQTPPRKRANHGGRRGPS